MTSDSTTSCRFRLCSSELTDLQMVNKRKETDKETLTGSQGWVLVLVLSWACCHYSHCGHIVIIRVSVLKQQCFRLTKCQEIFRPNIFIASMKRSSELHYSIYPVSY